MSIPIISGSSCPNPAVVKTDATDGLVITISKTIKNISRGAKVHTIANQSLYLIANGNYQNLLIQCGEFTTAASCKSTLSHKFSICFGY